jgi:hypothetical protein
MKFWTLGLALWLIAWGIVAIVTLAPVQVVLGIIAVLVGVLVLVDQ